MKEVLPDVIKKGGGFWSLEVNDHIQVSTTY